VQQRNKMVGYAVLRIARKQASRASFLGSGVGVIASLEWFEGGIDGSFTLGPASLHSGAEPDKQAQINLSSRTNHPGYPTCYLVRLLLVRRISSCEIVVLAELFV
jgi:hypothetical protein